MYGRPMRTTIFSILMVVTVVACSAPPVEPADADDCADLVEVGVTLVREYFAGVELLPVEVFLGEEPAPPEFQILVERSAAFDVRMTDLGCDTGAVGDAVAERTIDLQPTTVAGEIFVQIVQGRRLVELG